jgi:hypothetical protein
MSVGRIDRIKRMWVQAKTPKRAMIGRAGAIVSRMIECWRINEGLLADRNIVHQEQTYDHPGISVVRSRENCHRVSSGLFEG